jgi:choline dehydrogenase-like flavoprotein
VWRARNTRGPLANTRVLRRWLPVGGHGWSDHPDLERRYTGFTILLNVEQPPHPDNRVVLGRRRDALGMPVAELHWRWRAEDHARLVRVRDAFRRAVDALGIGRVTLDAAALPDPNAHHHAGTTRMDGDARRGVVDTDCRVHALDNLYVAGASVFPTAGFANPTLTIVALAIRLAERLAAAD